MPDVPLEIFRLCLFAKSRRFELIYVSLATFFGKALLSLSRVPTEDEPRFSDIMTFFVIVCVSFGAGFSLRDGKLSILRTIVQDATMYFFGIFAINLVSFIDLLHKAVSSTIVRGSLNHN